MGRLLLLCYCVGLVLVVPTFVRAQNKCEEKTGCDDCLGTTGCAYCPIDPSNSLGMCSTLPSDADLKNKNYVCYNFFNREYWLKADQCVKQAPGCTEIRDCATCLATPTCGWCSKMFGNKPIGVCQPALNGVASARCKAVGGALVQQCGSAFFSGPSLKVLGLLAMVVAVRT